MDVIETELCDYVQVKHTKLEPASGESSPTSPARAGAGQDRQRLPSKFYKVAQQWWEHSNSAVDIGGRAQIPNR